MFSVPLIFVVIIPNEHCRSYLLSEAGGFGNWVGDSWGLSIQEVLGGGFGQRDNISWAFLLKRSFAKQLAMLT